MKEVKLLQGNQAIAAGAIYAGARFYAGYPITPSSEVAEECSRLLPQMGGVFLQMEDEIASMAAIIGASLAGAKAFTATSGPGFSLMQENLGLAVLGEVPCVIINVQRAGPSTGLATKPAQSDLMQIRWGRHGDQCLISLIPSSVTECYSLTVQAFNLAERYRVPVVLAPDEVVAHMRENVIIPAPGELPVEEREKPIGPPENYLPFAHGNDGISPLGAYGSPYVFHVSSSMHGPDGYSDNRPANAEAKVAGLHRKIERDLRHMVPSALYEVEDAEILIVATGIVARACREAARRLRRRGMKVGVLQIVTLWPFPEEEVSRWGNQARQVLVAEMNYSGQLAGEVRKLVDPAIKLRRVNKYNGEVITVQEIMAAF